MANPSKKIHPLLHEGLFGFLDPTLAPDLPIASLVENFVDADCHCLILRSPTMDKTKLALLASELADLREVLGFELLLHNDIETAHETGATGVHLSAQGPSVFEAREILGNEAVIGVSVHNLLEAKAAEAAGADYVILGAIFPTEKNHPYPLVGLESLKQICVTLEIPVYAIGGMSEAVLPVVKTSGAYGFCALRAVYADGEIEHNIAKLGFLWEDA